MSAFDWANSNSFDVFFRMVSMVLLLWKLLLFKGMGMGFKDKIMLHCFRKRDPSRVSLQGFGIRYILF